MTIIPIEWGSPEYDLSIKIRYDVLRKPINMEFTAEQLSEEWTDVHLACYDTQAEMLGCLILTNLDDKSLKMRQVAVAAIHQRKGVGQRLVEASEQYAKQNKFEKIVLNARITAVPFYISLGYQSIGKEFQEVGIVHQKMEKLML